MKTLDALRTEIAACQRCAAHLPHGPRPVLQVGSGARILIAGQAPGRRVHESGIPFDDASGTRLRSWMGLTLAQFYDPHLVAIVPMGFCYPGTGSSGDLPPRPECAPTWRRELLAHLPNIRMRLVLGQYAQAYHLPERSGGVTALTQAWRETWPGIVALPHPSPRNNLWLKKNPWFDAELVPALQRQVALILSE
jgi:uracil-DNA glycosylase